MTSSFFILLLMLIYANNPVAHSLQADLSLIFSRGWKWILLLFVQPVCARKAAQFYHMTKLVKMIMIQIHNALCTVAHGTSTCELVFRCISLCSQNCFFISLRSGDIIGYGDFLVLFLFLISRIFLFIPVSKISFLFFSVFFFFPFFFPFWGCELFS